MLLKRKKLSESSSAKPGLEKENEGSVEARPLGLGLTLRQPFKPPLASRPEANGLGAGSLGQKKLASKLGAQSLLAALTRTIVVGKHQQAEAEGLVEAPEVVLFEPADYPDLPEGPHPYVRVVVDPFLAAKLRPHQVKGVQFMYECLAGLKDPNHTGLIQADSMGLGKTFQSLCIMWMLLTNGLHGRPTCSKVLILTPSSLVTNWGREIEKWVGGRLKPYVVEDTKGDAVKSMLKALPSTFPGGRVQPVVLICSYTTFRLHMNAIYDKKFELLVCDEAHNLKNGESQINKAVAGLTTCKLRLLLSGTPIQNNLGEFWAMFDAACPGLLGTPSEFRRTFQNAILAGRDSAASEKDVQRGLERSAALVDKCSPYMLRRTSHVLKSYLPPKVQQVIFCRMGALQQSLYRAFLASAAVSAALEGRKLDKASALSTLPAITAVKKLCSHPDLVYGLCAGPEDAKPGAGSLRGSGRSFSVGGGASGKVSSSSAAVVTGFEGLQELFRAPAVYPPYKPMAVQTMHSGKFLVLEALLKAVRAVEPTDKVVIVSMHTESLDLLKKVCAANQWPQLRLDGSAAVKQRQATVDRFNDAADPSFILLLSSKAGGVGLNIIGANRLVLLDSSWNPADDAQAAGRVWREGQKKQVFIYRFLTTGSIEEKIYQRQLQKEGLSRVVVDDNAAAEARTFSRDELRGLFKMDPQVQCDTHTAIKCGCTGTGEPREAADGEQEATSDNILGWAHLRDVAAVPDAAWGKVSDYIRDKFVTFAFSDHNINDSAKPEGAEEEEECSDDESIDRAACSGEEEESDADVASDGGCSDGDGDEEPAAEDAAVAEPVAKAAVRSVAGTSSLKRAAQQPRQQPQQQAAQQEPPLPQQYEDQGLVGDDYDGAAMLSNWDDY